MATKTEAPATGATATKTEAPATFSTTTSEDESLTPSPKPEQEEPESSRSLLQKQQKLQRRQKEKQEQKKKKRHGARNQHRHKFFVKWLLERFDLEDSRCTAQNETAATAPNSNNKENTENQTKFGTANDTTTASCDTEKDENNHQQNSNRCISRVVTNLENQNPHILDVAGGKGEVAARLTMCHQQRVVMVDPRPADIVDCYERLVLPKIPNKWQRRVEEKRAGNPNFVRDMVESRFRQLVTTFEHSSVILDRNDDIGTLLSRGTSGSRSELTELQVAIRDATLLVGLHADGATEAIVDAALFYRKPFVVVPCCVFPSFFPMRRILTDPKDGSPPKMIPVRTHEQFCTYILRKDPRFVMEELPFEGRNIAIWWDGK